MRKILFLLLLLASPVMGAELTTRQREIIGRLIIPRSGGWAIRVEGGTAAAPWLNVTGTLPAGFGTGGNFSVTSSGSSSIDQRGVSVLLGAGYTGSSPTAGIYVTTNAAGTNAPTGGLATGGNAAMTGIASATTAGTMIGVAGYAENTGSGFHVGAAFSAHADPAGRGYGVQAMGSSSGVGLYATLRNTAGPLTLVDSFGSALVADNGQAGGNWIFTARHGNSSNVLRIGTAGALWAKSGTKALTDGVATDFVRINAAVDTRQGGTIRYCVDADDGTDYQTRCGTVPYAIAHKTGAAPACAVGTQAETVAVTAGTLTATITASSPGAGNAYCTFRANAASSLTETTLRINYHVEMYGNSQPTNSITPQ